MDRQFSRTGSRRFQLYGVLRSTSAWPGLPGLDRESDSEGATRKVGSDHARIVHRASSCSCQLPVTPGRRVSSASRPACRAITDVKQKTTDTLVPCADPMTKRIWYSIFGYANKRLNVITELHLQNYSGYHHLTYQSINSLKPLLV